MHSEMNNLKRLLKVAHLKATGLTPAFWVSHSWSPCLSPACFLVAALSSPSFPTPSTTLYTWPPQSPCPTAKGSQPNKAFFFLLGVSCLPVMKFVPFRMIDLENILSLQRKLSLPLPHSTVALFVDSQEDNIRTSESKAVYSGFFSPGMFGTSIVQLFTSHTGFNSVPLSFLKRKIVLHILSQVTSVSNPQAREACHQQAMGHQSNFTQGKECFSPYMSTHQNIVLAKTYASHFMLPNRTVEFRLFKL